jgi:ribonuclease P protein component
MNEPSRKRAGQAGPQGRKPHRLTRRADYVAAAKGRRFHSASLSVQAFQRQPATEGQAVPGIQAEAEAEGGNAGFGNDRVASARFGLTVSRKVGNAVVRNRVKRRLREALKRIEATAGLPGGDAAPAPGWDYVIVARTPALTQPFDRLVDEIASDIAAVHRPRRGPQGGLAASGSPGRNHRTRGKAPSSSETR